MQLVLNHFKSILNLDSNQISHLYDALVQEGQNEVTFSDLESLLQIIKKERKDNQKSQHKIILSQTNFNLLRNNIFDLIEKHSLEEFKILYTKILRDQNFLLKDLNDKIISKIYSRLKTMTPHDKEDPDTFLLNNFDQIDDGFNLKKSKRKTSSIQKDDFEVILEYIDNQVKYFLDIFLRLKKNFCQRDLNSLINDYMTFVEIMEEKRSHLKEIYDDKIQIMRVLKNKLNQKHQDIMKSEQEMFQVFDENSILQEQIKNLREQLESEKRRNSNLQDITFQQKDEIIALNRKIEEENQNYENATTLMSNLEIQKNIIEQQLQNRQTQQDEQQTKDEIIENQKNQIENINQKWLQQEEKFQNYKMEISYKIQEQETQLQMKEIQIQQLQNVVDQQVIKLDKLKISNSKNELEPQTSLVSQNINQISLSNEEFDDYIEMTSIGQQEEDYPLTSNVKLNMSNIQNIIQRQETKQDLSIEKLIHFNDYVYICYKNHKQLYFFHIDEKQIYILSPHSRNVQDRIALSTVTAFSFPYSNNFLFQIEYKSNQNEFKTVVFESPFAEKIQQILYHNNSIRDDQIKLVDYLKIENDINFLSSSLNLFSNPKFQGFMRVWINSMFHNWDIYYFILIDNLLIQIPFPKKLKYKDFFYYLKNTTIHRLDNFTSMKQRSQDREQKLYNLFALKLINENTDLVINTSSLWHLQNWTQSVNNLYKEI